MRQPLPRVPMNRIAVLIGVKGATAKSLRYAAGCKEFNIDSETGDVEVLWGEPGTYDPVKAMKLPNVIKAIGRGMAPKAAIQLLDDHHFFELVDIRKFVGKKSNQQRRIRGRIIGSDGKIRKLIEGLTDTQITIYNSTVVLVGEEEGLSAARQAVEMIAGGAEHGTVLNFLERDRRRSR
ncbi:MAG: KH domain-containing protein, partial [Candidatus Poseidoniaceae archaeon]|nr:KH domain-containing protein [Candidatus Poseidoniaceae archaeon]